MLPFWDIGSTNSATTTSAVAVASNGGSPLVTKVEPPTDQHEISFGHH